MPTRDIIVIGASAGGIETLQLYTGLRAVAEKAAVLRRLSERDLGIEDE